MNSFLILLFIALFQSGEAQITVTLLDHTNQPIRGQTIEFASEQKEVLASCMTNLSGRCTMSLHNQTDPSGLIRGTLITGHEQRPVIFKGELFEITLTLDETDQLHIPSDAYVTRTPQSSPDATVQIDATATTITEVDATPTTTTEVDATPTTTTEVDATPTTTTQIDTTATTAPEGNNFDFWFQLSLIIILIAAAMIYIWTSQKQNHL